MINRRRAIRFYQEELRNRPYSCFDTDSLCRFGFSYGDSLSVWHFVIHQIGKGYPDYRIWDPFAETVYLEAEAFIRVLKKDFKRWANSYWRKFFRDAKRPDYRFEEEDLSEEFADPSEEPKASWHDVPAGNKDIYEIRRARFENKYNVDLRKVSWTQANCTGNYEYSPVSKNGFRIIYNDGFYDVYDTSKKIYLENDFDFEAGDYIEHGPVDLSDLEEENPRFFVAGEEGGQEL